MNMPNANETRPSSASARKISKKRSFFRRVMRELPRCAPAGVSGSETDSTGCESLALARHVEHPRRGRPGSGRIARRPRSRPASSRACRPHRSTPRCERRGAACRPTHSNCDRLSSRGCARREARRGAHRGTAAARQARDRPDRARHPPRPRRRAAQAARAPGRRPARRADHRRLHRPRRRPLRALGAASDAHRAQIEANAATFREQALRILDPDPARLEVRHNGEWLDMPMAELLRLVGTTTVAQLLERDDFAQRYAARAADLDARAALPAAAGV